MFNSEQITPQFNRKSEFIPSNDEQHYKFGSMKIKDNQKAFLDELVDILSEIKMNRLSGKVWAYPQSVAQRILADRIKVNQKGEITALDLSNLGFLTLPSLHNLSALKELDLRYNHFTDQEVKRIKERFPFVKI